MFEQRLPYGLWDADQHFPEPQRSITDYIDPRFRDSGKMAVDVIRRELDRIREEAKAAGREVEEIAGMDDNAIRPGTTLNKLNPWKDLSPDERETKIAEFRALGDKAATADGRLEIMD